jgi:hypothetical protein
MDRTQFITQILFNWSVNLAPVWYGREFAEPAEVNSKMIAAAEDLWDKYQEAIRRGTTSVIPAAGVVNFSTKH